MSRVSKLKFCIALWRSCSDVCIDSDANRHCTLLLTPRDASDKTFYFCQRGTKTVSFFTPLRRKMTFQQNHLFQFIFPWRNLCTSNSNFGSSQTRWQQKSKRVGGKFADLMPYFALQPSKGVEKKKNDKSTKFLRETWIGILLPPKPTKKKKNPEWQKKQTEELPERFEGYFSWRWKKSHCSGTIHLLLQNSWATKLHTFTIVTWRHVTPADLEHLAGNAAFRINGNGHRREMFALLGASNST